MVRSLIYAVKSLSTTLEIFLV